jgi:Helicase associated domain
MCHCRVPPGYKCGDGYWLGQWVRIQRPARDKIDPQRRLRLEALAGWSWNLESDKWDNGFSHLKEFSEREKHCRVADGYKSGDGFRLGQWVRVQRAAKDKLAPDRRLRLEALSGWSWNAMSDRWEEGFSHLRQFSEREGHCRVPRTYMTDDGYTLGRWVEVRRGTKDKMAPQLRLRLEGLAGWSWDVYSDLWEVGFARLRQFSEREGHCRVPDSYRTEDGDRVAKWAYTQRKAKETMDPNRRQRLEALPGWVWKTEE